VFLVTQLANLVQFLGGLWRASMNFLFATGLEGFWPGWRGFLRYMIVTMVLNFGITLVVFSVLGFQQFWRVAGVSYSIGTSCFLVTWLATVYVLKIRPCDSLFWMLAIQPVGALVGASFGHLFLMDTQPFYQTYVTGLVFALPSGLLIYLISRATENRVQAQEREAEQAKAHQRATEIELKTLQNQIEPHFLFNTLANVSALIELDPSQAQRMLGCYSEFLRSSMRISQLKAWPLREELALVRHYLTIQQTRFPDIQVRIELPASCAEYPVPPLLVQPLVENAYEHGLRPLGNRGTIEVLVVCDVSELKSNAAHTAQNILVKVRDTGAGLNISGVDTEAFQIADFNPPRLVPESTDVSVKGSGVALNNIRRRLDAIYGPAATLDVRNRSAGQSGVEARLVLPLIDSGSVELGPSEIEKGVKQYG
jgi:sensor histidine kinase YesM